MGTGPDIICIGSVLWDVIGRRQGALALGEDRPGRIARLPGGVALNVAMTLRRLGLRPALLSVLGDDAEGRALLAACAQMGLITDYLTIDADLATDHYMAIEAQGQLVAALADAHALEAAGTRVLAPLRDGRLGAPWTGPIVLDGNLTQDVLAEIAADPVFAAADLRIAPASPGKVARLRPFLDHPRAIFYVNCLEAGLLTDTAPETAQAGAQALLDRGAARVLVTQGAGHAVDADPAGMVAQAPRAVDPQRVTGAGDTFMAAHIAAELGGADRSAALSAALAAAADFVAG